MDRRPSNETFSGYKRTCHLDSEASVFSTTLFRRFCLAGPGLTKLGLSWIAKSLRGTDSGISIPSHRHNENISLAQFTTHINSSITQLHFTFFF